MTIIALVPVIFCLGVLSDWDEDGLLFTDDAGIVEYQNELIDMPGHDIEEHVKSARPIDYVDVDNLPMEFDWGNVNGGSYITQNLNQHIPQYCGSCWAHGTISALADRIKIQRKSRKDVTSKPDINLAVQVVLNCASDMAGSCYGGTPGGVYQYIQENGIPYSTCQPYIACSEDSSEGFCSDVDTSCSAINTCRTCSTFESYGGGCYEVSAYPNATIAEYGKVTGAESIKSEVFARGPIAVEVNATPLLVYTGGIINMPDESKSTNHVVSITGWGLDEQIGQYWIVRNSWGEYWGELGFFRIVMGGNQLGIEKYGYWAVPGTWTELNAPCFESGVNCNGDSISAMGWHEDDYKSNIGRYLSDSPSDYWRWDSDGDCKILEEAGVTLDVKTSASADKTIHISTSFGTIIAFGLLISLFSTICGAFCMRRWDRRRTMKHIPLEEKHTSGTLSLQVQKSEGHNSNLYVVENCL